MTFRKLAETIADEVCADDGITISIDGAIPREGFAVGIYPEYMRTYGDGELTVEKVEQFIRETPVLDEPDTFIGVWWDEDRREWTLDAVGVVKDRKLAEYLASELSQNWYYDLAKDEEIKVRRVQMPREGRLYYMVGRYYMTS